MRRQKLEDLVKIGIIDAAGANNLKKMLDGLTKWLKVWHGRKFKATRDRDAWKVMIFYISALHLIDD